MSWRPFAERHLIDNLAMRLDKGVATGLLWVYNGVYKLIQNVGVNLQRGICKCPKEALWGQRVTP